MSILIFFSTCLKKLRAKFKSWIFHPRGKLCLAVPTHGLGCGYETAEKQKLPMNFIFSPCHLPFFDSIINFRILESSRLSFVQFRAFFLFFYIFPISRLWKIIKNNFDLEIFFCFFQKIRMIFLCIHAKFQLKILKIEFFRGGCDNSSISMFPPATCAMSLKAL